MICEICTHHTDRESGTCADCDDDVMFIGDDPRPTPHFDHRHPIGPPTYLVCEACNYNDHRCFFCGDDLRHAETIPGPNYHACYVDADDHLDEMDRGHDLHGTHEITIP